jgi:hypothetical protein
MSVTTRASRPDLLLPGIQAIFGHTYDKLPKQYATIFDVRTSKKASENVVEVTGLGMAAVKSEGQSISYDGFGQGPKTPFIHVTYGLGFVLTREAKEDNLYQDIAEANAQALPFSMLVTKETVHANVLNRAFSSSYTGGDGQALLSASHPTVNGTQSNLLTAADLSEAALEDAVTNITLAKNSAGLPIALRPVRLVISPTDLFNASRILKSEMRVGTANNDINALKMLGVIPEVTINNYLTDTDAWFTQTNAPNGLISYQRRALGMEEDNDFDTENDKFKATERYSCGWGDWRSVYGSQGV